MVHSGIGNGKVEGDIVWTGDRRVIIDDADPGCSNASHLPSIFAQGWMTCRFNGTDQLEFGMFLDKTDQRFTHTSGCAAHNNICWHALSFFFLNSDFPF
jgi:hypothetical protein